MFSRHAPEITVTQVRAARGWLRWTQDDLSHRSGLSKATVVSFELEQSQAGERTLSILKATFEAAGIVFLFEGGRAVGLTGPGPAKWLGTPVYETDDAAKPPSPPQEDEDSHS